DQLSVARGGLVRGLAGPFRRRAPWHGPGKGDCNAHFLRISTHLGVSWIAPWTLHSRRTEPLRTPNRLWLSDFEQAGNRTSMTTKGQKGVPAVRRGLVALMTAVALVVATPAATAHAATASVLIKRTAFSPAKATTK